MPTPEKHFKIGDLVTWTSQAGGYAAEKIGKVIAVVPAGKQPIDVGLTMRGAGFSRKHESYVVEVSKPNRRKVSKEAKAAGITAYPPTSKLYWPVVSILLPASPQAITTPEQRAATVAYGLSRP